MGDICDNIGFILVCPRRCTNATESPTRYMNKPSRIPILSQTNVGNPYTPSFQNSLDLLVAPIIQEWIKIGPQNRYLRNHWPTGATPGVCRRRQGRLGRQGRREYRRDKAMGDWSQDRLGDR